MRHCSPASCGWSRRRRDRRRRSSDSPTGCPGVFVPIVIAIAVATFRAWLVAGARWRPGAHRRRRGARHRLPLRPGPGDPHRDHRRHRPRRATRRAHQERHRAGECGPAQDAHRRQNRHADRRQACGYRRAAGEATPRASSCCASRRPRAGVDPSVGAGGARGGTRGRSRSRSRWSNSCSRAGKGVRGRLAGPRRRGGPRLARLPCRAGHRRGRCTRRRCCSARARRSSALRSAGACSA